MATLHLGALRDDLVTITPMTADGLLDELAKLHAQQLRSDRRSGNRSGLGFQRVAYFLHPDENHRQRTMNVTIVKPDECRYWTRSMAMRDADQLTGAIMTASGGRAGAP
jgi:hypothetical protein